jgi:CubicO group peptidase (beta-lactamase class C family)
MLLIEDGKMKLDQPIADFLPAFANMKVQNIPDGSITDVRPAKGPITVRQLLTHTAGLGYNIIQKGPIKTAYDRAGIVGGQASRLPIPGFADVTPAPSLAVMADRLAELPLVYEPGTKWSYSISLDLMGRLIEVVSGQAFDAFLKARLFDPLGMASTGFMVKPGDVARFTSNYAPFSGALIPFDPAASSIYLDPPPYPFGGGGLVSSARDYDRFLAMLLGEGETGGVRVMKPETARLAMSNLIDDSVDRKGSFIDGQGFGAGGRVSLPTSPGGEGIFGWAGAAGTIGFVHRRLGYRAAGYTQIMPPEAVPFQAKFGETFFKDVTA